MARRKIPVILTILTALTACGTPPLEVTRDPVSAGVFSNVQRDRLTGKSTRMVIRAFADTNGTKTEVDGARCRVRSDELSATVITPQTLIVPTFKQRREFQNRGVPSALVIDCEAKGYRGRGIATPLEKEVSTTTGAGIAGAIITTVASAAIATASPWVWPGSTSVDMVPTR